MQGTAQHARTLREAAHLIDEFGHCKNKLAGTLTGEGVGPFDPRAASFCAGGALMRACRARASDVGIQSAVLAFGGWNEMVNWNNREETTGADVSARMRAAADKIDGIPPEVPAPEDRKRRPVFA